MQNWLEKRFNELLKIEGYTKPKKYDGIKLDSNENLVLKSDFIRDISLNVSKEVDLREYPLKQVEDFYMRLSQYTQISKKYLSIGNGSDQIIDLILSTFGKKNRITTFTPTFTYFVDRCKLYSVVVDKVPLRKEDNSLDKAEFLKSAKRSQIIYICSPNNPTGNQIEKTDLLEIINQLDHKLIIIDEAYVDFANYSAASNIIKKDNIIVLRTLSKALGLAGARLGYCISNEKFTNIFKSVIQSPYPINTLSLCIGTEVLKNSNYIKNVVNIIKRERERIFDHLQYTNNGIQAFKSDANFIFIQITDIDKYKSILGTLEKEKIRVKALGNIEGREGGHIRVTIGTKEMNDMFLQVFQKI